MNLNTMNRRVELCSIGFNHLLEESDERKRKLGEVPGVRRNLHEMRVATALDYVLWKKQKKQKT